MTQIPSTWPGYFQEEEMQFLSAVGEYTDRRIGLALNYLYDLVTSFGAGFSRITASGNFSVPANVHKIIAIGCGGGGGGGGDDGSSAGGGGGGASKLDIAIFSVTPADVLTVVIGNAGGGAANASNANGTDGNATSVQEAGGGTTHSFVGGQGGRAASVGGTGGVGGGINAVGSAGGFGAPGYGGILVANPAGNSAIVVGGGGGGSSVGGGPAGNGAAGFLYLFYVVT